MSRSLVDLLRSRAAKQPTQKAFSWLGNRDDDSITYAQLDRRARSIGACLEQAGPPGERALLLFPPGLDFVAALFGCLYAGWVAVPAYPPQVNQRLERIRAIASDAEPRVGLTTQAALARIQRHLEEEPNLAQLHWLAIDAESPTSERDWIAPHLEPDSLAVLQYTSGSTAAPRGVMLSHANLLHNTAQIQQRFEAGPHSRGVIWLPPYHDMGLVGGILEGVYAGFPVALMAPVAFLQRPRRWLEAITRTRATISGGPNFAYELCVDRIPEAEREGLDLSTWQVAFNGSEPVRADTLRRFSAAFGPHGFKDSAFYPCYGLAEATLMVSGGSASAPPVVRRLWDGRSAVGCGQVIDDQRMVIVDGEVWVAGPSVAAGYWRQPALSKGVFGAHLPGGTGPYLRTGDLGFIADDELFITGRIKATLNVGGRKFQAEDIEACLVGGQTASLPGSTVALSAEIDGKERLFVIQEVRSSADFDAIVRSIRSRIAEVHQIPVSGIVLIRRGGLPKTSSGKVRRAACRDGVLNGNITKVYEWRAAWL